MAYDTLVAMSREKLEGKKKTTKNSCTQEEVILQYRPASGFLFSLVWEGRSVVVIQVVSLNFRLLHVTHIHTVEKLLMLMKAYYNKDLIKLDVNT